MIVVINDKYGCLTLGIPAVYDFYYNFFSYSTVMIDGLIYHKINNQFYLIRNTDKSYLHCLVDSTIYTLPMKISIFITYYTDTAYVYDDNGNLLLTVGCNHVKLDFWDILESFLLKYKRIEKIKNFLV